MSNDGDIDWLTPRRLLLALALLILTAYPEVILGTHSFFYRDFGLFTYPVAHYARESFWRGEFPLWNPLNNCGIPFLAQWNTTVCYPPSLIYLVFPLPWSLNYFCLGHLLLAGAGMYALAWRWTGHRFAASVAGLVYALNGLTFNCLMWTSNLAALAWVPLVVLHVELAWRDGGRRIAWAALAAAMQLLSGAPEIVLITWGMLAALWLGVAFQRKQPLRTLVFRVAAVGLLALGLSALQLFPFFELVRHSHREALPGDTAWSMPAWGWANFFVPLFHCSPSILGVYSQTQQQWTSSYYVGLATVALALIALRKARQARVGWLAAVGVAGLLLAMGGNTPVHGWIARFVPGFGLARYPVKFVALTVFALPLLAGFAVREMTRASSASGAARRGLVWAGAGAVLISAGIVFYARWFPSPEESWAVTLRSGASRAAFLLAILTLLGWFSTAHPGPRRSWVALGVLLLLGFDVISHAPRQNPTAPVRVFSRQPPPMPEPPLPGVARAMVHPRMQALLGNSATPQPEDYYLGVRRSLYADCNLLDGIPKVNGFYSLYLREEAQVRALLYTPTNFPAGLADFLGVAQLSSADELFRWNPRPSSQPLLTTGARPIFADAGETLRALAAAAFDPRQVVYLPAEARGKITATNAADARILAPQFSAHALTFEVEAQQAALVVAAQSSHPAWRGSVDGKPASLFRANHAFQALEVPAGRHKVALKYDDQMFRTGAILSALSLLGCLGWLVRRTG